MPLSTKLFLSPAIATSSLLLAATQPLTADAMPLSCGPSTAAYREVIAPSQSASGQGHIVHPIASSPQALVTSEQEWTTIWREHSSTAQARQFGSAVDSRAFGETILEAVPTQAQSNCRTKEEPSAVPAAPEDGFTDDIPNLDPSALPPATSPATPATDPAPPQPTIPATEPPTPGASGSESPSDNLPAETSPEIIEPAAPPASSGSAIPSRPVSPPPGDPEVDPTNVTPTSEPAAPFDGIVVPTLASLPDGVYRYLSGNYEYGIYSDEQLVANGGAIFLLTKTGDNVVGNFYPKFGQPGVCIEGTVRDSSVVGPAYVIDETSADTTEVGESYVPYAGIASLQVRQPQRAGNRLFYAQALLDLSEYSRINAGTALAPSECGVPSATTEGATDSE